MRAVLICQVLVVFQLAAVISLARAEPAPERGALKAAPAEPETAESANAMAADLFASSFKIDDRAPEVGIPTEKERNADPIQFGNFLITLSDKAEDASKRGDYAAAAKYFRAIAASVPDRSVGFSKLCSAYESLNERAKAEAACGAALLREGATTQDYSNYVRLVIAQREPLDAKQIGHVDEAMAYLRTKFPDQVLASTLACQLALRQRDETRLEQCSSQLRKQNPKNLTGISYAWLLAVMRLDRKAAQALVEDAKSAGAAPAVVDQMSQSTHGLHTPLEHAIRQHATLLGGLLIAALVSAAVLVLRRRVRRPPSILRKSGARV